MSNLADKGDVILFYYSSMRSFLLYHDILKTYPHMFDCVIEMPAIPYSRKTKKRNYGRFFKVLRESPQFFIMSLFTVKIYTWLAQLFKTSIKDICSSQGIKHYFYEKVDDELIAFLKDRAPAWIISSTSTLLPGRFIEIPECGVLNLHEAPLPAYRGSACYFWFFVNGEKYAHVTAHYVVEKLDAGDVICEGPKISIEDKHSVFALWKDMLLSYEDVWGYIIPYLSEGKKMPAKRQPDSDSKGYSYPSRDGMAILKQKGVKFLAITDLFYVFQVAFKGSPNKAPRGIEFGGG